MNETRVVFPLPALVCDIGGTNVRVAAVTQHGKAPELLAHLRTGDFPDLEAALRQATEGHDIKARSVVACGAGPVDGTTLTLTNARWHVDGRDIAKALGLEQGLLLNDFEAQALALPSLHRDWLTPIGTVPDQTGTRIIMGPGTGLGAAGLVEIGSSFLALVAEVGHVDLGPVGDLETALWPHLDRVEGRVTVESVISGPGLVRLHRARFRMMGRPAPTIDAPALVDRAQAHRDGAEADTVRLFWTFVARVCGDVALASVARGGLILSGGVLPRLLDFLDADAFRATFEAKAPLGDLMRRIPTSILVAPDAVLTGMAAIASNPDQYVLSYKDRLWC